MTKVDEASAILHALGFDAERCNERSSLTLLALLELTEDTPWAEAKAPLLGTLALMEWTRTHYNKTYAPNSRETVRRFTLHQFVEALLVEENADKPDRPKNSPKWNYSVNARALQLIHTFGTDEWDHNLADYLTERPGLIATYAQARQMRRIPVTLPNGDAVTLSPGGQNTLIKAMVEDFGAYYAPGAHVIYVGDAETKTGHFDRDALAALGVSVDEHGKMPDLVLYMPDRDWLLLLEAASSHGPVDGKRKRELATLFADARPGLVYVSCFPDRATFRKYAVDIAWETEAWVADNPTHLVHFNGERFLGPYETAAS